MIASSRYGLQGKITNRLILNKFRPVRLIHLDCSEFELILTLPSDNWCTLLPIQKLFVSRLGGNVLF